MRCNPEARGGACIALMLLLACGSCEALVFAGPPPLPADMQAKVDTAINKGVNLLKATMGPWGTWTVENNHVVGYAALPGLTLLECGVPTTDPRVQRAAVFVRKMAPTTDATYEIALSILFLDKLGNAKDGPTIQVLAMRLVAGQTPTGGWTYKCPILSPADQKQLLTVLKKLDNPVLFDPIKGMNPVTLDTGLATERGASDPLTGAPRSSFIDPLSQSGRRNSSQATRNSPREQQDEPLRRSGASQSKPAEADARLGRFSPTGSRNWAWCIKMEEPGADAEKVRPKVTIPARFKDLPVFFPAGGLQVMDPPDKIHVPIWGTSDNSNTQFAILALWAARRHHIPTDRTLNMIAKRFYTSQNADGSWGYHYAFGGSAERDRPPMTCVGLLGLAVAHGLAHDIDPSVLQVQDPWIVNGLVALTQRVGVPQGRTENLPMANLYFLWSVERVGVLFDLPTIGNKEWYRWGAEILVANQEPNGNWDKGGYHGSKPITDTCLALLFLKRANLARDLTAKIAFKADDLLLAIAKKLPDEPGTKEKTVPAGTLPDKAPALDQSDLAKADGADSQNLDAGVAKAPPARRSGMTAEPIEEKTGNGLAWFFALLLLLVACGVGLALLARDQEGDEEEKTRVKSGRRVKKARA